MSAISGNAPEYIPRAKRSIYKSFFVNDLKELLPCWHCRNSFIQYSDQLPIEAFYDSRGGLLVWNYKIHQKVNEKLSKPDISFFDYIKQVESMRAKCSKTGAKGCIEPHIEKDESMCKTWAAHIWSQYDSIDICAFKRKSKMTKIMFNLLIICIGVLVIKFLFRFLIMHRNTRIVKYIS